MGAIKNYYHDEICALPETPDPYDDRLAREQGDMNIKQDTYRFDQYGDVYEYSPEHEAYLFIGKRNGRTKAEFIRDYIEYKEYQNEVNNESNWET